MGFAISSVHITDPTVAQLEDPFGYDKADIKVDAIVEDLRVETSVLIAEWRRGSEMFTG